KGNCVRDEEIGNTVGRVQVLDREGAGEVAAGIRRRGTALDDCETRRGRSRSRCRSSLGPNMRHKRQEQRGKKEVPPHSRCPRNNHIGIERSTAAPSSTPKPSSKGFLGSTLGSVRGRRCTAGGSKFCTFTNFLDYKLFFGRGERFQ